MTKYLISTGNAMLTLLLLMAKEFTSTVGEPTMTLGGRRYWNATGCEPVMA